MHFFENSVDPDQLASLEASRSGSTCFYLHDESPIITKILDWMEQLIHYLRNEFDFLRVHGIMNTSGLLQSK